MIENRGGCAHSDYSLLVVVDRHRGRLTQEHHHQSVTHVSVKTSYSAIKMQPSMKTQNTLSPNLSDFDSTVAGSQKGSIIIVFAKSIS